MIESTSSVKSRVPGEGEGWDLGLGSGLGSGASHTASLTPLPLTTDLTVAAALVRKAYSKRRRSRLWSKPVNLRRCRGEDSCQTAP